MTLRLERWQGKWIAKDVAAGYYAELSDCDAYTIAADFHRCEELRLRVEASRFPKDLPQQAPS